MAGTTRSGYSGGDGGDEGQAPGAAGKATVFGHDAHLLRARTVAVPPGSAPDPGAAASPPPTVPAEPPVVRIPTSSGKSGFPARAGFWGRRNTQGDLEPAATPDDVDHPGEEEPVRRRRLPPLVQHALVVLASATLSFLAVLLTLKLREPSQPAGAKPAPTAVSQPPTTSTPPSPVALPPPPASPDPATPTKASSPPPAKRPRGKQPARRASSPRSPGDRVLAPSFGSP